MKKVLVTGAAGYIGRHVVDQLIAAGCQVIAADFLQKGINPKAEYTSESIFSGADNIYDRLGRPDCLIHLAWRNGFDHNAVSHMEDLSDHVRFLYNMIDGGLPTLSVMGTMHEVGYWEGAINADTPCNPQTQYGLAKVTLRKTLEMYLQDKKTSLRWLRAYYIYGDDAHGSSIFSKIYRAAQNGERSFPFTTGENKYDFIHIDELAKKIVAATFQNHYEGIINVCSGKPISLAEQVEKYIKGNALNISLEYGAFPNRKYDSPAVWGNPEIINDILENLEKY